MGRLFVTSPSRRSEGRGEGNRKSEGPMPDEHSGRPAAHTKDRSMGPVPPDGSPPNVPADAGVAPPGAKGDRLQRAFEAEMVLFLREQSTKLQEEVEQLRNLHRAKDTPGAAMSTPSPLRHGKLLMEVWALGLGIVVYMLEVPMRSHEHVRGATPKVMVCMMVVTLRCTLQGGGALRQEGSKLCSRCGSHQTELGFLSGRLRKLDAPPMPPFPTSVSASAEFRGDSAEIQTRRYELFDAKRRGDSQWVPLCMREGKSCAPITTEDKAERLEREVVELKAALGQMRLSSSGSGSSASIHGSCLGISRFCLGS